MDVDEFASSFLQRRVVVTDGESAWVVGLTALESGPQLLTKAPHVDSVLMLFAHLHIRQVEVEEIENKLDRLPSFKY